MSQCRKAFKKQKLIELDYDCLLSAFKFIAALAGSMFLVSFVLMLLSLDDVETRVIYIMILIINLIILSGSIILIVIINNKNKKIKKNKNNKITENIE